jgi:hypothetical protein
MNIQKVITPHTKGVIIEALGRCIHLGFGFDKSRKLGLRYKLFRLTKTRGFTGNFGIGKAWVFFGTWSMKDVPNPSH